MSAGGASLGVSAELGERADRYTTECGKLSTSAQKRGCFWVNGKGWLGESEVNPCIFPTVFNRNG